MIGQAREVGTYGGLELVFDVKAHPLVCITRTSTGGRARVTGSVSTFLEAGIQPPTPVHPQAQGFTGPAGATWDKALPGWPLSPRLPWPGSQPPLPQGSPRERMRAARAVGGEPHPPEEEQGPLLGLR